MRSELRRNSLALQSLNWQVEREHECSARDDMSESHIVIAHLLKAATIETHDELLGLLTAQHLQKKSIRQTSHNHNSFVRAIKCHYCPSNYIFGSNSSTINFITSATAATRHLCQHPDDQCAEMNHAIS